jgi:hypothetical protein
MAKKKTPPKKEAAQLNFWQRMSINRRLDLAGIVLALLGLFTFLILGSVARSPATDLWVIFLTRSFGWGRWLFPAALMIVGVWLIIRNQESIPHISIERVTGIFLFFFWLLTILQIFTTEPAYEVAFKDGAIGGGYWGALFMRFFLLNLGLAGATIALLAWLLIALSMTLDLSIREFFERVTPPFVEGTHRRDHRGENARERDAPCSNEWLHQRKWRGSIHAAGTDRRFSRRSDRVVLTAHCRNP